MRRCAARPPDERRKSGARDRVCCVPPRPADFRAGLGLALELLHFSRRAGGAANARPITSKTRPRDREHARSSLPSRPKPTSPPRQTRLFEVIGGLPGSHRPTSPASPRPPARAPAPPERAPAPPAAPARPPRPEASRLPPRPAAHPADPCPNPQKDTGRIRTAVSRPSDASLTIRPRCLHPARARIRTSAGARRAWEIWLSPRGSWTCSPTWARSLVSAPVI